MVADYQSLRDSGVVIASSISLNMSMMLVTIYCESLGRDLSSVSVDHGLGIYKDRHSQLFFAAQGIHEGCYPVIE